MNNELIELVRNRKNWVEISKENDFELGIKRLLSDLYPDNAHFIYELLQNAEDTKAKNVRFILSQDQIEFEHDGERLFSVNDIDAITSIGCSTKRDDSTSIGKFGVGFKAVFSYTDSPEIHSGTYHFKIRDMVVPELLDEYHNEKSIITRIILPFNSQRRSPQQAFKEIEQLLRSLDPISILFLTNIEKIEYQLPNGAKGYLKRIEKENNRTEVIVQHPDDLKRKSCNFLKFNKDVQVCDHEVNDQLRQLKNCRISIAYNLVESVNKEQESANNFIQDKRINWQIVADVQGCVCIYFPADKETSNLRFHIHAPFASTVARDSVRDCLGNNQLRDYLAILFADSMITIREYGLLNVRTLAVLPNNKDNLSKFYEPFRLNARIQ